MGHSNVTRPSNLIAVVVLVAACILLRAPSLEQVSLNPDENQYEARAAYHLATGTSAFSQPYGATFTVTVFKWVAAVFGPFAMVEVRVLVLLACLAMALMVHRMVARVTTNGFGLLAGLVFLHLNVFYEGLAVNREWPASFLILLGAFLYSRPSSPESRWRAWLLVAAGLASGAAVWFKLQAVYLPLAVAAVMLWKASIEKRWRPAVHELAIYGCGGILSAALYCLPYWLGGTLGEYLETIVVGWDDYVGGNAAVLTRSSNALGTYFDNVYWGRPFPVFLLVGYAFCASFIGRTMLRTMRRERPAPISERDGLTGIFVISFVAAVFTVQMGRLFFDHYYLFLMAPLAGLFGLAAHRLWTAPRPVRGLSLLAAGLLAAILLQRSMMLLRLAPDAVAAAWPGHTASALVLVVAVVLLALRIAGVFKRVGAVVTILLILETGLLAVQAQSVKRPEPLPLLDRGYDELVRFLHRDGTTNDRLFVWGWAPEIYSLAKLEPASHFSTCLYLVNDFLALPRQGMNPSLVDLLMEDLRRRRPRFIVDASRRSWTMEVKDNPWIYWLELYPEFELNAFLREHYVAMATRDGCDVYMRRSGD